VIRLEFNRPCDVRLITNQRWFRFAAVIGLAPGSHKGLWKSSGGFSGGLVGWNYRVGPLNRCLTVMAHTRRLM
jgi:hypothetical protein